MRKAQSGPHKSPKVGIVVAKVEITSFFLKKCCFAQTVWLFFGVIFANFVSPILFLFCEASRGAKRKDKMWKGAHFQWFGRDFGTHFGQHLESVNLFLKKYAKTKTHNKYINAESAICNPYTPAQSKHTFSISTLTRKCFRNTSAKHQKNLPKVAQNGRFLWPFCEHFPIAGLGSDSGSFFRDLVPKWVPNGPPVLALLRFFYVLFFRSVFELREHVRGGPAAVRRHPLTEY